MRVSSPQKGFSLIELMVVLSITGLVLTMSIPSYISVKIKAARLEMTQNFNVISTLFKSYHAENETYTSPTGIGFFSAGRYTSGTGVATCEVEGNHLGFAVDDCWKLRYRYQVYPWPGPGHPHFDQRNNRESRQLYFTIAATSQSFTPFTLGNPPIPAVLCSRWTDDNPLFRDAWLYTEENETLVQGNGDALKLCFD